MSGLFGDSWSDPKTFASLNLAAGLLGGGNFGQALGRGLQGYSGTMADAEDRAARKEDRAARKLMQDMQMQQLLEAQAKTKAEQQWRQQLPSVLNKQTMIPNDAGPTAGPDTEAINQFLLAPSSPFADKLLERQLFPKEPEAFTLSPGQQRYQGSQVVASLPEKVNPNQPFVMVDGQVVPNKAYQDYELNKADRSATRVNQSVNTGNALGTTVAKGVGEQVNASLTQARGASDQIQTLNRLREALDSGKVMAGPTSAFRQYGAQLASVFGIADGDTKERLNQTRQAMQSMAQLELDAAAQMRGQGAITENERGLIRRAAAGEIDTMTTGELRSLTDTLGKVADFRIKRHNEYAAPMIQQDQNLSPYLSVPAPALYPWRQQSIMRQNQPTQQGGGFRIIGVE
jgi:hypothetical protein